MSRINGFAGLQALFGFGGGASQEQWHRDEVASHVTKTWKTTKQILNAVRKRYKLTEIQVGSILGDLADEGLIEIRSVDIDGVRSRQYRLA